MKIKIYFIYSTFRHPCSFFVGLLQFLKCMFLKHFLARSQSCAKKCLRNMHFKNYKEIFLTKKFSTNLLLSLLQIYWFLFEKVRDNFWVVCIKYLNVFENDYTRQFRWNIIFVLHRKKENWKDHFWKFFKIVEDFGQF